MHVRLDPEPVEEEFGRRLRKTARTVRLNGFRPGKAPVKEVRRRFGTSIRAEVAVEMMQSSFQEALQAEQLQPAGAPTLDPGDLESTEGLAFTATFEVLPDIEVADLAEVKISRPEAEVTAADVDAMVARLREGRTTWTAVERPAEAGDRIRADLAECGGGDFRHEGMSFVAGEEFFLPNVAEAALGMTRDETKRIVSTFPEAMADEDRRGKEAELDLTVREIEEGRVPDLDEAFFESFGVREGGEEAFREEVKKDMDGRLTNAIRGQLAEQVMARMLDLHAFDVPRCLVAEREQQIRSDLPRLFGMEGGPADLPDVALEMARGEAEKNVREMLLIRAVVERQGLTVDGTRVRAHIEQLAASYEHPEQVVNWYYSQDALLQRVESEVLKDQVVDYVLSVADVATVPSSHDAVMAGPPRTELPEKGEQPGQGEQAEAAPAGDEDDDDGAPPAAAAAKEPAT